MNEQEAREEVCRSLRTLLDAINSEIAGYNRLFEQMDALIPIYEAAKEQRESLIKEITFQEILAGVRVETKLKRTRIEMADGHQATAA